MSRGRFIVFEGIDGSGKSSTLQAVAHRLQADGADVVATREETEGTTGEWVRASIRDGADPLATTFLFLADRAQHAQDIEAWLAAGRHVLCDRFMHSTLAYQSVTLARRFGGDPSEASAFLRRLHEPWCPRPDAVLLFDADVATCLQRTRRRGEAAPYEKQAFLEQVRESYLGLARTDGLQVLDAARGQDDVLADVLQRVRAALD